MKSLILTMSMSGTAALLVYLGADALLKQRLKSKWKRRLLLIVMSFYLFPLAYFKYRILGFLVNYQLLTLDPKAAEGPIDERKSILVVQGKIRLIGNQKLILFILLLSGIISLTVLLYKIWLYQSLKIRMRKYRLQSVSEKEEEIFRNVSKELSLKRSIQLKKTSELPGPVTTGMLRSVIWLPEKPGGFTDYELKCILQHEMAHIKHHDLGLYFVGLVTIALHWFNPFCYLLLPCISMANEQYSDETVVKDMKDEEKLQYCGMILQDSKIKKEKTWIALHFSEKKKRNLQKRIDFIMKKQRKSPILAILAGILSISVGVATSFAYEKPPVIQMEEPPNRPLGTADWDEFSLSVETEAEELPYDDFFTDSTGQVFPVKEAENRNSCDHRYVDGARTEHLLDGQGGCRVDYYDAKRCTLCGDIKNGECYQSISYKMCPHERTGNQNQKAFGS